MTRRLALLLLVLTGLAVAPFPFVPAAASCASPQLSVDGQVGSRARPVELVRGQEVTVEGRGFVDGCDDQGGGDSFGCTEDEPEPTPPIQDATLLLLEDPEATDGVELGVSDADAQGRTSWTFTLPTDAPPGPGVLRAISSDLFVTVT